jgi:class 3 adenylate cyclase
MTLKDELTAYAKKTHDDLWVRREGRKIPDTESVTLGTDAVTLNGTVLYADLSDSTSLVRGWKDWFAAEVYKNYLYCASRIIKAEGGEITAFDGDRIMAVYLGDSKNTSAVRTGLKINWTVRNILQPAMLAKYPNSKYEYHQKVGIDTSALFVAKTGIRGSNDLVWVGNSANNAAKMAALDRGYSTYITGTIYNHMNAETKFGGDPKKNMWTDLGTNDFGYQLYGSRWLWRI